MSRIGLQVRFYATSIVISELPSMSVGPSIAADESNAHRSAKETNQASSYHPTIRASLTEPTYQALRFHSYV